MKMNQFKNPFSNLKICAKMKFLSQSQTFDEEKIK